MRPQRYSDRILAADPEAISALFPLLPSLQRLHLRGISGRDPRQGPAIITLLQTLTWPTADNQIVFGTSARATRVCPDLKEIHCSTDWKDLFDVPWKEFRDLVKSRVDPEPNQNMLVDPFSSSTFNIRRLENHRGRVEVLSLMGLRRDMGNDVLQRLDGEERGALNWLIEADRSGIIELRLKKLTDTSISDRRG